MKKQLAVAAVAVLAIVVAGCSQDRESVVAPATDGESLALSSSFQMSSAPAKTYEVTIYNLSNQPLSPPVAATHDRSLSMFRMGGYASAGLEAIAENGDPSLMFNRFDTADGATDAVNVGMPLTRYGTTVGDFMDNVTFQIDGQPGQRFSLATMLICTNDGFTGLNSVVLPGNSRTYYLYAYDAGTEDNTEASEDIVDACSALGPEVLDGDENGNENDAVDTDPRERIRHHAGIHGGGDLDPALHGWNGPIGKVMIRRIKN